MLTILFCHLSISSFNYWLNFLIPAVITQLFIVAAELAMHARIPNKKPKSETETHPVILDAKISKCSV